MVNIQKTETIKSDSGSPALVNFEWFFRLQEANSDAALPLPLEVTLQNPRSDSF